MGASGGSSAVAANSITASHIVAGAVTTRQLNYVAATDVVSGGAIPAGAWIAVGADQAFSVADAASIVDISVRGCMVVGNVASPNASVACRLVVDAASTPVTALLGGGLNATAAIFTNVLGGAGTVALTGLAVGAHTVGLELYASADANAYCRPGSYPFEGLAIVVEERKR